MEVTFEWRVAETDPTCVGYLLELVSKQKKVRFHYEKLAHVYDGGSTIEIMFADPKSVMSSTGLCCELCSTLEGIQFSHYSGDKEIAEFTNQWAKFIETITQTVATQPLEFRRQTTFSVNILSKRTPDAVSLILVDRIYITISPVFRVNGHDPTYKKVELTRNCKCCNREFNPKNRKGVYCSTKCRLKDYRQNHSRS